MLEVTYAHAGLLSPFLKKDLCSLFPGHSLILNKHWQGHDVSLD